MPVEQTIRSAARPRSRLKAYAFRTLQTLATCGKAISMASGTSESTLADVSICWIELVRSTGQLARWTENQTLVS
jgi:hypothetical protein